MRCASPSQVHKLGCVYISRTANACEFLQRSLEIYFQGVVGSWKGANASGEINSLLCKQNAFFTAHVIAALQREDSDRVVVGGTG